MTQKVEELQALVKTQGEQIEIYKALEKNYEALVREQKELIAEQRKQIENLKENVKDRHMRMRMAIALMLSTIKDGYKFPDEEKEQLFYEFCDDCGVTEQDRKELFTDNK